MRQQLGSKWQADQPALSLCQGPVTPFLQDVRPKYALHTAIGVARGNLSSFDLETDE